MILPCLSLILVALIISCPLTWLMRKLGVRLGQVDLPGERKVHTQPIPATGGVAIFLGLILPMLMATGCVWVIPASTWESLLPAVVPHLEGIRQMTPLGLALAVALTVLHITGLIDDRRGLGPFLKLGVQAGAAALVVFGFGVQVLDLESIGPWPGRVITVLWFLTLTNSFNFLDNMDGLSGGVAVICSAIMLTAALIGGQWFIAALLALLIGALLGFLVFNIPPASIFMGDAGSLVIGFVLAFCAVRLTYYSGPAGTSWWAVFTPLVVFAIPLYDLTSVTLIRIAQGKSPFVGDTQHFSHRLVRKGLSKRSAVVVVWACTLACGVGGILLGHVNGWQACLIGGQTAAIVLVLALFERTGDVQDVA